MFLIIYTILSNYEEVATRIRILPFLWYKNLKSVDQTDQKISQPFFIISHDWSIGLYLETGSYFIYLFRISLICLHSEFVEIFKIDALNPKVS